MVGKISKQTPPQRRYTNGKTHGKNIHLYLQKKKKDTTKTYWNN